MKITYFLRDPREGNYSIEQIFGAIGNEVSNQYEVRFFYVDGTKSKLRNILEARKVQGDINHITGDVNWLAFGLKGSKTLLTVHDLGHFEQTLHGIKKWIYGWLWLKLPFTKVKAITTISQFTKERLEANFPDCKKKVQVIYNPLIINLENKRKQFNVKCPRILQIGSMANKNLERLVDAIVGMESTLVMVRKPSLELKTKLDKIGIKYEFHYSLSEEEIQDLYRSCDLLFFASTYEGFGMPIIEGQAMGIPVITSNICSMPEVAGLGACLIDPTSVLEIKEGIMEICSNSNYRDTIVKNGLLNIERFKLKKIVEQYMLLYKTVADIG